MARRANILHLLPSLEWTVADRKVPGDLAEVGVWMGTTFVPMAEFAWQHGRHIHAVDSFHGMSEPTAEDGSRQFRKGALSVGGAGAFEVLAKPYKADGVATVHVGVVPDILSELADCVFAFVHLDLDQYAPTLAALRFLWERLSCGGVIACHDFDPDGDILAARAAKEFVEEIGREHLEPFDYGAGWEGDMIGVEYQAESGHIFLTRYDK